MTQELHIGGKIQSKELTGFYNTMQTWIDEGCPFMSWFSADRGMCSNLKAYIYMQNEQLNNEEPFLSHHILMIEMKTQFRDSNLDETTPFNKDVAHYTREMRFRRAYDNESRLLWIKAHTNAE